MNNINKNKSIGRPRYTPVIPRGNFTFPQFVEANKGKCTPLTLRNYIKNAKVKGKKLVLEVKGKTADPINADGLGRRLLIYTKNPATVVKKDKKVTSIKMGDSTHTPVPSALTVASTPTPAAPVEAQEPALEAATA